MPPTYINVVIKITSNFLDVSNTIYACDCVFLLTPLYSSCTKAPRFGSPWRSKLHGNNMIKSRRETESIGKTFLTRQARKIIYCQFGRNANVWLLDFGQCNYLNNKEMFSTTFRREVLTVGAQASKAKWSQEWNLRCLHNQERVEKVPAEIH